MLYVNIKIFVILIVTSMLLAENNGSQAQAKKSVERAWMKKLEKHNFKGMPYRLIEPITIDHKQTYPLVLFLHGMGGRGTDNLKHMRNFIEPFTQDELRKKYPHYFIAPQTPHIWSDPNTKGQDLTYEEIARTIDPGHREVKTVKRIFYDNPNGELTKALNLVDAVIEKYPVNTKRIYVIGHSMGGFGTWNAIWLRPNFFAAAIPSAGALFPNYDRRKIAHIPIWSFHGEDDKVVDYQWGKNVFNEMKSAHANMKFTTIFKAEHGTAADAFGWSGDGKKGKTEHTSTKCDPTESSLAWLFGQTR